MVGVLDLNGVGVKVVWWQSKFPSTIPYPRGKRDRRNSYSISKQFCTNLEFTLSNTALSRYIVLLVVGTQVFWVFATSDTKSSCVCCLASQLAMRGFPFKGFIWAIPYGRTFRPLSGISVIRSVYSSNANVLTSGCWGTDWLGRTAVGDLAGWYGGMLGRWNKGLVDAKLISILVVYEEWSNLFIIIFGKLPS